MLTIIATIKAKSDKIEFVRSELEKLIPLTRAEEGCLTYDLHQDNHNPAHFVFYETWGSHDFFQAHLDSQHLTDYLAATDGAIEEFTINQMTRIG